MKQSFLYKNLESAEFINKKHWKPALHSLKANHVLEMSVKLKFRCVHFEKKHGVALVVLNYFLICFHKTCSHDAACIMQFFCTVMLKRKKGFMNQ